MMIRRFAHLVILVLLLAGPTAAEERSAFSQTPQGMLIGQLESDGCRNIPNFRFDKRHTAGGCYQITDTNWHEIAPMIGIDSKYTNAGSAPEFVQGQVAFKMWELYGCLPWAPFNPKLASAGLCNLSSTKSAAAAPPTTQVSFARIAAKSPREASRPGKKQHEWHDDEEDDNQKEDQVNHE